MTRMTGDILLVGSIPGETAEQAMSVCGDAVGEYLSCLPDGETGRRRIWINFLAATVYDKNINLETLNRPLPVTPHHPDEWRAVGEDWAPRGYPDHWQFKIANTEQPLEFPSLGYAAVAEDSYTTFCALRRAGKIPKHLKFMIAIPLVESAVRIFFSNGEDYPKVRVAYERALARELKNIFTKIPANDLVIQWDICMEILAIELNDQQAGLFPWKAPGEPRERFFASLDYASSLVPDEVLLGCHLCYGDLGHKHVIEPKDLALVVQLANDAQASISRVIDFFHMPVPKDRNDDAYFAPLQQLDIAPGKLYLGLIHYTDGITGAAQRLEQAAKYVDDFGLATECGFGRRPLEQIPALLEIHRQAVKLLAK